MNEFVEPEKITIVSGPAPYFHLENNAVIYSVFDGLRNFYIQKCTVRTMDGEKLMNRCRGAWWNGNEIYFEYHDAVGVITQDLIVAAKTEGETHEQLLMLWLRIGGKTEYQQ